MVVVTAVVATAEWVRRPDPLWVILGVTACTASLLARWPPGNWRRGGVLAALLGWILVLGSSQQRLAGVERRWPLERERRVEAASRRLDGDLHAVYHQAEHLAQAGAAADLTSRVAAFDALARLLPSRGPETSIAVLDSLGRPWAWAGRHRLSPEAKGDSIGARATGYYVVLEARRHTGDGGVVIASVLIWAHPAVPDGGRSLAELFRARTEVGLRVYPLGTAPDSADVFDYREPALVGGRILFSVQPIPPEQGTARELVFERGSRLATWLILLVLALGLSVAAQPTDRLALLGSILWLTTRAPIGPALGLQPLFSPATFFSPLLGPVSGSAGVLALAGTLLTIGGVWLWRQRTRRRWYGVLIVGALLLASPYLVSSLGRGITPPADGVSVGLWLTWQLGLLVSAAALIIPTAALLRGTGSDRLVWWPIAAGVTIALVASVIGVVVWSPRGGWPGWYTFLWTPALLLVVLPAPRWAVITGIALVAGSSSALVTWGAELSGRVQVAQRDIARLGREPDPLAVPLLERFADQVRRTSVPATGSEMYALWRGSALGAQRYPARLGLWSDQGVLLDELVLDSLDLPASLVSTMIRSLPPEDDVRVTQVFRVPGMHYVVIVRAGAGAVMTASIGPRSELILPGRVGRLLDPTGARSPLYQLTLAPPAVPAALPPRPRWRREGWLLRNEYPLQLAAGMRTVHAVVDLRGPVPLLVRGVLVVLLDVAVLAMLWFLAEFVSGARLRAPRWLGLARSFRVRLATTLAMFFLLPAIGFATWSFARLGQEVERSRDLLITQTLRDAVPTAAGLTSGGAEVEDSLRELSRRIDADLAFYQGGRLTGSSTRVLEDLGVLPRLMEPGAFQALAVRGELEVTRDGSIPQFAERVGYRVVQPGPPQDIGVLATPQVADDTSLAVRQLDLALVLLLATLVGIAAALVGAQRVSRALSRPVAELRRSALALGRGQAMPAHAAPPLEFEPVFGAFERMAADIRSSHDALEEARRRTATVLATVATGVVGLDPGGRVLIANRQALDLLGKDLAEGDPFLEGLPPEWDDLRRSARRFLQDPTHDSTAELEVGGRRVSVQMASLGPDLRGVVIALNDVTDVSRAERVLAWGEMARQVAHEIKNPLTPMRLGLQHLRRVYHDRSDEFDRILQDTADRMLAEIDRLDTIARAFSRFGAPADDRPPLAPVDLAIAVGEVVQLYRLAENGCEVRLRTSPGSLGAARVDEVKEVVVNLLENARNAGAAVVEVSVGPGLIRVSDDGVGIPPELLPRIFEPRFSTRTSGSGLGLAIVRRLVDSWGGHIDVESEAAGGTTVTLRLRV